MTSLVQTRTAVPVLLALSVVSLVGCGLDDPGVDLPRNECRIDEDCIRGTCDDVTQLCQSPTLTERLQVVLEVVPSVEPFGDLPVSFTFGPFDGASARDLELSLPLSSRVTGRVQLGEELITADITFSLAAEFDGEVATVTRIEASSSDLELVDDAPTNFRAALQAGRNYAVRIEPTGIWRSRVPPQTRTLITPSDPVLVPNLSYDYGDPEGLLRIAGIVRDGDQNPQDGVRVRCVDPDTGRAVSSVYETGSDEEAEPGFFEVFLLPSTERWELQITNSSARASTADLLPTFQVPAEVLPVDDQQRVNVLTPTITEIIRYQGTVEGLVESEAGAVARPLANAQLVLSSAAILDEETNVEGTYRTTVFTDDRGVFEAALLRGEYDVVITPQERELGVLAATVTIDPPVGRPDVLGQLFTVPSRTQLDGVIETLDGQAVFGANIQAQARGAGSFLATLGEVALFGRSADATTDDIGAFTLPLDVGVFDLILEPPAGSNFPWIVRPDVVVDGGELTLSERFSLSEPVIADGLALHVLQGTDARAPVQGTVRAYAIIPTADGGTRTILVAESETGEEGRFVLLLPPSVL